MATLHDYTLVCPSGGQGIHRSANHVCHDIDTARCARCFAESPFSAQMAAGRIAASVPVPGMLQSVARAASQRLPTLMAWAVRRSAHAMSLPVTASEIDARLGAAQRVFGEVDLFVAPSPSLAGEFKGVHVLLDAVRRLPNEGWTLKIFGSTAVSPDYVASLEKQAAGLPVAFEGVFARGDTEATLAQIDVLVVPSIWLENSPLVIHEAFMAGVPVVGARIGRISDLVRHGQRSLDPHRPTLVRRWVPVSNQRCPSPIVEVHHTDRGVNAAAEDRRSCRSVCVGARSSPNDGAISRMIAPTGAIAMRAPRPISRKGGAWPPPTG